MRKNELKLLFEKITVFVGNTLIYKGKVERWTDKEISEKCGIPQNRLTEIKNFKKYNRPINETFLAAFIGSGIVSISEIQKGVDLNQAEDKYIGTLKFYEDKKLRKEVTAAFDDGIDVIELIRLERERRGKG